MSMQLIRAGLGLDLRYFPPSSFAFSLVQVLSVGFLISARVKGLFFFFFSFKNGKKRRRKNNFLGLSEHSLANSIF